MPNVTILDSVVRFLDRQHGLYINGQWQTSQAESRLAVYNPADGKRLPQGYRYLWFDAHR
ncbi:hypothetical protein [Serratia fonticola]|uniref:hypothetical protein n=1 Tax=Serratia fonticola TaxID=47917 RepID=UPI00211C5A75